MDQEVLKKYFNNRCTEEELISVLIWFKETAKTPEGKNLLSSMWEELSGSVEDSGPDYELLLDKIHHKINISQTTQLLEISDHDIRKFKRRHYLTNIFRNVAAILLLPAIGFGLFMSFKFFSAKEDQNSLSLVYNEVFSSLDAITKVTLPDGSNVWLNHSSSFRYPASFQGYTRNVELKGEGYFEVAHNPKIPFIVKTGEIQVKASGTTFDILAYPEEDRIETSLIEGSVELQKTEMDGTIVNLLEMKPADLVVFNKISKEISTRTVSDDRYFSWKAGKLVFNREPMGEVVKKLSRWFNVEIQIKDPELFELTYTATFINESLPQVMELIAMVTPVKYSIIKQKRNKSRSFQQKNCCIA